MSNDLIENPSPRCPCLVILDTSGSMNGNPIEELNEGINLFIRALREDEVASFSVEVAFLRAGGDVEEILPFTVASEIKECAHLSANGNTPLGYAVRLGLDMLERRKNEYKRNGVAYYQPWLVMISDGAPTDDWQSAATRAYEMASNKKLVSLMVGVGEADMNILGKFSNRPACKLQGLKFSEFFQWLSASMSRVSSSNSTASSVQLPSMDTWNSI